MLPMIITPVSIFILAKSAGNATSKPLVIVKMTRIGVNALRIILLSIPGEMNSPQI